MNNTITGVRRREPFPGNTLGANLPSPPDPRQWRAANGSGIWISPGSVENEIVDNTFHDIAAAAIFLEGDNNVVQTRAESDVVRDVGTGNRVTRGGSGGSGGRLSALPPRIIRLNSLTFATNGSF